VPDTVDPVGGSYAIEALTAELEKRVAATLERVRREGGMLKLIEAGVPQQEIQEASYRYQQDVESGRRKIVGVNTLKLDEAAAKKPNLLKISPELEARQIARLREFKSRRDRHDVASALGALGSAARTGQPNKLNLFDFILNAVEKSCTLGEICNTLRSVFGEYHGR
jgi:methylmalonyl-CoA mutase N-terminal domain/subunit